TAAAATILVAAVGWFIARIFVGLDFTDEMQYYGEIAGLVRTGRFFQDDLFVQQLGYIFVLPFFKLHAAFFPDQSYLVLFGRLLLLAGYGSVGALFWRAAKTLSFSTAQRLVGLATFFAWVPFQIFSFGYNTGSYLLIVAAISVWMTQEHRSVRRHELLLAGLLVALGVVYPTAGLALTLLAFVDTAMRRGLLAALRLAGLMAVFSGAMIAIMAGLHGPDFFPDLGVALKFSRSFGVGEALMHLEPLAGWLVLAGGGGLAVCRLYRPRDAPNAGGSANSSPVRKLGLILLECGGAILAVIRERGATGYFAAAVFIGLLVFLRIAARTMDRTRAAELGTIGIFLGTIFAFTSGNGLHNFGVGAIALAPFLALYAARAAQDASVLGRLKLPLQWAPTFLAAALLLDGVLLPYREQRIWHRFERIRDVPAFAGIWTSPVKKQAVDTILRLAASSNLNGKRMLVAGPHAWIYFVAQAEPTTPMFFMHYPGMKVVHDTLAERLFHRGVPDVVIVPGAIPRVVQTRIGEWAAAGCTAETVALARDFIQRYRTLVGYDFAPEIIVLTRSPRTTP
ncbi:MAG: hypothetical protein ABIZ49_08290, partial [Opitutaceae bacterium]